MRKKIEVIVPRGKPPTSSQYLGSNRLIKWWRERIWWKNLYRIIPCLMAKVKIHTDSCTLLSHSVHQYQFHHRMLQLYSFWHMTIRLGGRSHRSKNATRWPSLAAVLHKGSNLCWVALIYIRVGHLIEVLKLNWSNEHQSLGTGENSLFIRQLPRDKLEFTRNQCSPHRWKETQGTCRQIVFTTVNMTDISFNQILMSQLI